MAGAAFCIWLTFSSRVMRDTRSAARCSGEAFGSWYFGVDWANTDPVINTAKTSVRCMFISLIRPEETYSIGRTIERASITQDSAPVAGSSYVCTSYGVGKPPDRCTDCADTALQPGVYVLQ